MHNNKEITLDAYRGSEIMKGFDGSPFKRFEDQIKTNFEKGLIDQDTFEKAMAELDLVKGTDPEKQDKVKKVMGEFKEGKLKTSAGETVTDRKQAVAIAMSEAGLSKAVEEEIITKEDLEKAEEGDLEKEKQEGAVTE